MSESLEDFIARARAAVKRPTHRVRRGKLVEIPEEWRGKTVDAQTKRKRHPVSRRTRKNKNRST